MSRESIIHDDINGRIEKGSPDTRNAVLDGNKVKAYSLKVKLVKVSYFRPWLKIHIKILEESSNCVQLLPSHITSAIFVKF